MKLAPSIKLQESTVASTPSSRISAKLTEVWAKPLIGTKILRLVSLIGLSEISDAAARTPQLTV